MQSEWFEVVSLALRYWYALLAVIIVLRVYRLMHYEQANQRRKQQRLPDAGCIGEFIVLNTAGELEEGLSLATVREGTLGSLRTADVVVPAPGVAARHADFCFIPFVGLIVQPRRHLSVIVDGFEITTEAEAMKHPLQHNSVLQVGEISFRLQVFAGIDLPQSPRLRQIDSPVQPEPLSQVETAPPPAPIVPDFEPTYVPVPEESTILSPYEEPRTIAPQPIVTVTSPMEDAYKPTGPQTSAYQPTRPLVSAQPTQAEDGDADVKHRRTRRRYGE